MRVLMLTPYLPFPLLSGGQIRTYNLLKQLANKHEITLFCLIKDDTERQYIPEIKKYCHEIRVFRRSQHPFTLKNIFHTAFSRYPFLVIRNHVPSVIKATKLELAQHHYDLIHAETFYMMPHLPETSTPVILVEQTIESLGYESYAQKAWWPLKKILDIDIQKIRHWEQHYWDIADRLIVMSEEDKLAITPHVNQPKKIAVVANGVDIAWFGQVKKKTHKNPTILFVGTFKWLPNREAVSYLVKKVWPLIRKNLPQAELHIVGNSPSDTVLGYAKAEHGIRITGNIPDIRDAFATADVLIAPVFSGKGTRYKVLESLASGTPIVATSTAVEGLGLKPGIHVEIGDSASTLAQKTIDLLQDPVRRKSMATEGLSFLTKRYDWPLISEKLDTIYQQMGSARHGKKNF